MKWFNKLTLILTKISHFLPSAVLGIAIGSIFLRVPTAYTLLLFSTYVGLAYADFLYRDNMIARHTVKLLSQRFEEFSEELQSAIMETIKAIEEQEARKKR